MSDRRAIHPRSHDGVSSGSNPAGDGSRRFEIISETRENVTTISRVRRSSPARATVNHLMGAPSGTLGSAKHSPAAHFSSFPS